MRRGCIAIASLMLLLLLLLECRSVTIFVDIVLLMRHEPRFLLQMLMMYQVEGWKVED
jgi:hypothetical protein